MRRTAGALLITAATTGAAWFGSIGAAGADPIYTCYPDRFAPQAVCVVAEQQRPASSYTHYWDEASVTTYENGTATTRVAFIQRMSNSGLDPSTDVYVYSTAVPAGGGVRQSDNYMDGSQWTSAGAGAGTHGVSVDQVSGQGRDQQTTCTLIVRVDGSETSLPCPPESILPQVPLLPQLGLVDG